jgi:hypothetical protein
MYLEGFDTIKSIGIMELRCWKVVIDHLVMHRLSGRSLAKPGAAAARELRHDATCHRI